MFGATGGADVILIFHFFKYALTLTHTMHNYNHASIVHSHRNVDMTKA